MKDILNAIKGLLSSKKGLAALVSALVWGIGKVGLDLPTEAVAGIVAPLMAFILGQGIADHGKEAAKIEAAKPE